MLYRFKSGATGDVLMTASRGDQMLDIIGKAAAAKGILAAAALPAAILALERAVAAEEAANARKPPEVSLLTVIRPPVSGIYRPVAEVRTSISL